jgi:signal recognition particle GTPase
MVEPVELSTRGEKQIRNIVVQEFRPIIDPLIQKTLAELVEKRAKSVVESMRYDLTHAVEKTVKEMYWSIMEEALKRSDFQALFRDEIIKYLHEKWACGSVPFDEHFDKAIIKAINAIVKGKGE